MRDDDRERDELLRRDIALFRFGVIAEIRLAPPGSHERAERIRAVTGREHDIPGTTRRRVGVTTIRDWLAQHREGGYEALLPRSRTDRGRPRCLAPATQEVLVRLKEDRPELSVRRLIAAALASGALPAGTRLSRSSVYRLLRHQGLTGAEAPAAKDRRRYSYSAASELWQADVMHGPKAGCDPADRRRRRKTYLHCIIDDATRVVPHAAFAFSEKAVDLLVVLKQAVLQRGVPKRLYTDNGSCYRSTDLAIVCAGLGTAHIRATPYAPQGKGKIERFFRTVRSQLLPDLDRDKHALASLGNLNRRLRTWIESEYHNTPHRGLGDGCTPLDRWARTCAHVRPAPPGPELDRLFLLKRPRKVYNDRTVHFAGRVYEVGAELVGQKVDLLVDPSAAPSRPIAVRFRGRDAGWAAPLDAEANARRPLGAAARHERAAPLLKLRDLETADSTTPDTTEKEPRT